MCFSISCLQDFYPCLWFSSILLEGAQIDFSFHLSCLRYKMLLKAGVYLSTIWENFQTSSLMFYMRLCFFSISHYFFLELCFRYLLIKRSCIQSAAKSILGGLYSVFTSATCIWFLYWFHCWNYPYWYLLKNMLIILILNSVSDNLNIWINSRFIFIVYFYSWFHVVLFHGKSYFCLNVKYCILKTVQVLVAPLVSFK